METVLTRHQPSYCAQAGLHTVANAVATKTWERSPTVDWFLQVLALWLTPLFCRLGLRDEPCAGCCAWPRPNCRNTISTHTHQLIAAQINSEAKVAGYLARWVVGSWSCRLSVAAGGRLLVGWSRPWSRVVVSRSAVLLCIAGLLHRWLAGNPRAEPWRLLQRL